MERLTSIARRPVRYGSRADIITGMVVIGAMGTLAFGLTTGLAAAGLIAAYGLARHLIVGRRG